ncbi:MAG TPA: iron ABC transporter permease, partial [Candidatus Caenarcaniphilales bacterium]|nr:iron ABC transporter permease [Candidatus Caenarcaniphilales bacterium]
GLAPAGVLDARGVLDVLARPFVREVAWFTLWQAIASTLLTVLAALPGAYVFARFEFPARRLLGALAIVPFVLPTVVVASAFLALLGPRSPLNATIEQFGVTPSPLRLEHTIWAILLAHVFYNYAVVLRIVGGVWSQLDPRLEEAARVLGATRWQAFRTTTLPLLRPAIGSAASIVFLFTFTSFGVVLLLGGPRFATLEVEIYRQTAQLLNLRVAATLALLQMVFLLVILLAQARYLERLAIGLRQLPAQLAARRPRGRGERLFVAGNLLFIGLFLGLPLIVLVERSLATADGHGLAAYTSLFSMEQRTGLFVPPAQAVRNSLAFAGAATALSLVLGLAASAVIAYRRGAIAHAFDALLMLPLGTSAVIVGFGFILALGGLPIDLRTSPLLIPIAHALVALPLLVRAVVPVMRSVDRRLREAAIVLGASPWRAWREIDLPVIRRAAIVGAGFAFAVSLGEFGATLFIARPETPTMPVAVFRLLSQPGVLSFAQAMAMSTLLMLVTTTAILLIDRYRAGAAGQL